MKSSLGIIVVSLFLLSFASPQENDRSFCTKKLATQSKKMETPMEVQKVYKLLSEAQWKKFHDEGEFFGSPVDIEDGFIHLSKPSQVARVKDKYYKDVRPLYIVEFQGKEWLKTLKWEKASNGDTYPHLYENPLRFENVHMIEICR